MQHLDIFGGGMNRPKGSDNESDDDDADESEIEEEVNGLFGGSIRLLYICFLYYF